MIPIRFVFRAIAGIALLLTLPIIGLGAACAVIYMGIADYHAQKRMTDREKKQNIRFV
jgi:hypothetical protein